MEVHFGQTSKLSALAGGRLEELLSNNKERPVLLLLSGGSSFFLLEHVNPSVCGKSVTIGVIDERLDPKESNFKKLSNTTFFKDSIKNGASCIDPSIVEGDTVESAAKRLNEKFLLWQKANQKGVIVATLGMGDDGHVAGIMPFPEDEVLFEKLFTDKKVLIRGYDAGSKSKYSKRLTSTLTLIRSLQGTVIFISGESKREALSNVLKKEKPIHEIPASILNELPNTDLYTDIRI